VGEEPVEQLGAASNSEAGERRSRGRISKPPANTAKPKPTNPAHCARPSAQSDSTGRRSIALRARGNDVPWTTPRAATQAPTARRGCPQDLDNPLETTPQHRPLSGGCPHSHRRRPTIRARSTKDSKDPVNHAPTSPTQSPQTSCQAPIEPVRSFRAPRTHAKAQLSRTNRSPGHLRSSTEPRKSPDDGGASPCSLLSPSIRAPAFAG